MVFGYDTVVNGASILMPAFFIYFGDIAPAGLGIGAGTSYASGVGF
jgi:hypothetical protein